MGRLARALGGAYRRRGPIRDGESREGDRGAHGLARHVDLEHDRRRRRCRSRARRARGCRATLPDTGDEPRRAARRSRGRHDPDVSRGRCRPASLHAPLARARLHARAHDRRERRHAAARRQPRLLDSRHAGRWRAGVDEPRLPGLGVGRLMRRRVLYDPDSPAAAAAAVLLADEFDVQPWTPGEAAESVVLTSAPGGPPPGGRTRVIGVVDPAAPGPWPLSWYGLVPAGTGRPLVARTVANAFADLDAVADRSRLERELGELNAIGIQLSAERNLDVLLETILTKAREIAHADAGSLYLVEDAPEAGRRLRFALAQNDSVEIPFRTVTLPLDGESVAGHVALTGAIVNLADAYEPPPGSPFKINRWFDEHARYRTKSMLVVPMRTPQGEIIGALQLINCKPERRGPLRSTQEAEQHVRPYGDRHVRLAGSLASQAAVALANRRLYDSISQLFDGFVKASVTAIESRDPTTFGHSFRVADLTVGLAETVDRADSGRFRDVRFTAEELRELRYAGLLHDFGKVGVRAH